MGSLIDELQRREAAARPEAEELRGRMAQLAERLAGVEEELSRLVIAREVVGEVLGGVGAEVSPVSPASGRAEVTVPAVERRSGFRRNGGLDGAVGDAHAGIAVRLWRLFVGGGTVLMTGRLA